MGRTSDELADLLSQEEYEQYQLVILVDLAQQRQRANGGG